MSSQCIKRLQREYQMISRSPVPHVIAKPNPKNILEWHYILFGPEDSYYKGGVYHGKLRFPTEFPHKPPSIMMCTPSGRFMPETRLCLSMSDFHPESWNPMWSVSSILTGLLSFMLEETQTHGSIVTTEHEKRKIAAATMQYNRKNPVFTAHFPELLDQKNLEKVVLESYELSTNSRPKEPKKLLLNEKEKGSEETLSITHTAPTPSTSKGSELILVSFIFVLIFAIAILNYLL